jgi:hypothetical protein
LGSDASRNSNRTWTRLRINVLAVNASAQASYRHAGFVPYQILFEKLVIPA